MWVQSLGREDPGEGKATHSSILAWRIPWTTVRGAAKSQTRLSDFHFMTCLGAQTVKSLHADYGPWGRKESDMTEQLHFHFTFLRVELQEYRGDADVLLEAYCERDTR